MWFVVGVSTAPRVRARCYAGLGAAHVGGGGDPRRRGLASPRPTRAVGNGRRACALGVVVRSPPGALRSAESPRPAPPHGQAARGTAGLLRALQAAPAGAAAASPQQRARAPSAERGSGRRTRRQAEAGGGRGAAGKASRAAGRQSSRGAKRCGGQAAEAGRARGAPGRADGGRKRRQAGRGTGGRPGNGAGSGAGRGGRCRLATRGGPYAEALRYGAAGPAEPRARGRPLRALRPPVVYFLKLRKRCFCLLLSFCSRKAGGRTCLGLLRLQSHPRPKARWKFEGSASHKSALGCVTAWLPSRCSGGLP